VVGQDRLPQQVVRFLFTCLLCRGLYLGMAWARWLTIVLLGLGAAASWSTIGESGLMNMMGLIFLGFVLIVGLLLFSPGMGQYFSPKQRQKHQETSISEELG